MVSASRGSGALTLEYEQGYGVPIVVYRVVPPVLASGSILSTAFACIFDIRAAALHPL